MKLTGLRSLYASIKQNNSTYGTFTFSKNNVLFEVFFDIDPIPHKLGFILRKSNFDFWLDVERGFEINPIIDNSIYNQLKNILKIKYDPNNPFSPKALFEEFNRKIPSTYVNPQKELIHYISIRKYGIEKKDKLYFSKFMPWETQERTYENTEKTRLLLPQIYERIKNRPHISIGYTDICNNVEDKEIPSEMLHPVKQNRNI